MGKFDEAIDCFETVITQRPSDVLAYNHIGTIYAEANNHEKAIQAYLNGLKVDQNHPILHLNLAKSYEACGQKDKALSEYELALRSKPGWYEAITNYSNLLLSVNRTRTAANLVRQALSLNPRDVKMYVMLGNILMLQSDYENASDAFKKALAFDPNNDKALVGLAESFEAMNQTENAVEMIERVVRKNPEDSDVLKKSEIGRAHV